jgi:D-alanyl-D-alanine carboxypeptidase
VRLDRGLARVLDCGVPGALALSGRDGEVSSAAAGVADRTGPIPLTTSHRFPVGSVSKTFLGALVLQLAAQDRLRLDDALDAHLPETIWSGTSITIRQLLNHTSGLADYLSEPRLLERLRDDPAYEWSPRELIELSSISPAGEPGRWSYSNTNYVVLGLLVEALASRSLSEQLEAWIAVPLGLRSTSLASTTDASIARGYVSSSNPLLPSSGTDLLDVTDLSSSWAWPAVVSTAEDVACFLRGLLGGELLPPELLEGMLSGVEADWTESDRYGLGIEEISSLVGVATSPHGALWGHLGFGLGHTVVALATRDGRRQAVLMVNEGFVSEDVWRAIADVAWIALS